MDNARPKAEVGLAIFGLGRIGTIHLENLVRNPRAQILYCVEESSERMDYIKTRWKLNEPETTYLNPSEQSTVFSDKRVDAILVCTPTYSHEEITLKSLQSGKAVFCEKPLSFDLKGIERCLEASKIYGKPVMCGFNRRFDPSLRSLKLRVDSGEIGKVQVVKTCSRDHPRPPTEYLRTSGGIFQDCSVHDLDYVCWVLGEFPVRVSCFSHVHMEDIKSIGDQDTVVIMMKFPSGALATIDLSRNAVYGYDQRVEFFGPKGMLTCGEARPSTVRCHGPLGSASAPIYNSFQPKYRESYQAEMEHFLSVAQGLEECDVEGSYVRAVYIVAAACQESAESGKVVTLHWDQENGI